MAVEKPILIKNLVSHWPLVNAAKISNKEVSNLLINHDSGYDIFAGCIPANAGNRLFYNKDMTGFNFTRYKTTLSTFLARMDNNVDDDGLYLGSTLINKLLPTLSDDHCLPALSSVDPLCSIWVSNQTQVPIHQDRQQNIACCVAGKRRFTLFPPEQVANLYIGPLDFTPAGQAISLVDIKNPDFTKFPDYSKALNSSVVAELTPGDGLYIPTMWWHHVEGLSNLNILVNFWWYQQKTIGEPLDAMLHAMLNIGHLNASEKAAWQAMFSHYVFNDDKDRFEHIVTEKQGILALNSPAQIRQLRTHLLNKLNR